MIKEALYEKYSYQIDENNIVHLFRGEEDCQQHLTNPLLSAIFKIEALKKENAELKQYAKALEETDNTNILHCMKVNGKLYKVKEILRKFLDAKSIEETCVAESEAEQFLKECGE